MNLKKQKVSAYMIPGVNDPDSIKKPKRKYLFIEEVKQIVALYFGIPLFNLSLKNKSRKIVEPRQVAHYFARKYTEESFALIGKEIGGVDHATVIHSIKTIDDLIDSNRMFEKKIQEISTLMINKRDQK